MLFSTKFGACATTLALLSLSLGTTGVAGADVHRHRFHRTSTTKAAASSAASSAAAASSSAAANGLQFDPNAVNCQITVPANALTAQGLATPYILNAPCSMGVAGQQAFVEAVVIDPATGALSVYHPLVITQGTQPLAPPVVPTLAAGSVIGIWFGFNGGNLQLQDAAGNLVGQSNSLANSKCVNGLPGVAGDIFTQYAYCNAPAFFAATNKAIAAGLTTIPALGTDNNGNACPTTRSFQIVDQDPNDNVPTKYLLQGDQTAQNNAANAGANPNATVIVNGSDEILLTLINPLVGCKDFEAPSLDAPGTTSPALALNELSAAANQKAPISLVPLNDPMCLLTAGGGQSAQKVNAYRAGVDQLLIGAGGGNGNGTTFCTNLITLQPPYLMEYQTVFTNAASPNPAAGSNMFTFLCQRFVASLTNLNCNPPAVAPVVVTTDGNGVATACTINLSGAAGAGGKSSAAAGSATTAAGNSPSASSPAAAASPTTTRRRHRTGTTAAAVATAPANGGGINLAQDPSSTAAVATAPANGGGINLAQNPSSAAAAPTVFACTVVANA